ncbi:MAG: sulfotransferase, partial [Gammaproteobacteria bacterium]|nr:sulfotransferase [Gammaproteobacteria bacterium]
RSLIEVNSESWRQRYLSALPDYGDADNVVDKQPLNFRSIGLIRVLFPDSPILFMRRHAVDVGLSIFRHKFAKSWPCAHHLADIGHYYGIHERMFRYWVSRPEVALTVVDYSHLVRNPDTAIHALLASSGLDFEPACLQPHKTRRQVATFSSVQVQNPVTTRYINRSAPYAQLLQPLRDELLRAGVEVC